jgi:DNA-binding SARP family transcriptional activator
VTVDQDERGAARPSRAPDAVPSAAGNAVPSAAGNAVPSAAGNAVPSAAGNALPPATGTEIFCRLPYGLVVLDDSGSILDANPAAVEMGWQDSEAPPVCCHEIFDCRGEDGPCRHGCLVQRAAQAGEPLPEIRIDTLPGSSVSAMWVTAAPLGDSTQVLLHLRPGDARDRRRRSDPHWIKGSELTIKVLGRTRVDSREGPLGGSWVQQRPGQILKYLISERDRVVEAEQIADALWPNAGREALASVRHYIHALRAKLEPARERRSNSTFIVTVRGGYAINRRHVQIDADVFAQAINDGLTASEQGDAALATARLELAMSLYRGDFLSDEPYAEWAMPERDRLRSQATEALRTLARLALGDRDLEGALRHLDRLTEFEPFDSDVHRDLFGVLLAAGRRSEAARRFSTFRARVQREFGTPPEFELSEVAERISA